MFVLLRNEMAEILWRPRWLCFWGAEYTGDLSKDHGDGGYGYFICGLRQLQRGPSGNPCVVYSFGSNGDFDFERAIARIHGGACEIHIFDVADPGTGVLGAFDDLDFLGGFHRIAVLDQDGSVLLKPWSSSVPLHVCTLTLPSIMAQFGHSTVDVLKIDIEGNEYRVIAHLAEEGWPSVPGQVYLELHASP